MKELHDNVELVSAFEVGHHAHDVRMMNKLQDAHLLAKHVHLVATQPLLVQNLDGELFFRLAMNATMDHG